jgi:iron complex outermembrane receptor protein
MGQVIFYFPKIPIFHLHKPNAHSTKTPIMKIKLLLSSLFIFIAAIVMAQDVTISGNVQDDKKQPLPGATVRVKGTTVGTVTDDAGNYTLSVPKTATTLVISFVGFEDKEVAIKTNQGNYVVNVDMSTSDVGLNQVVVSASKKSEKVLDAPASISVIGADKLERNITTTPVDQLKTSPGVDVMRTGLVSSNVVVRGFNNIFSGSVLNVVDNRIGAVPSLRVNAYQLTPTSNLDYDKIEVVRGPASALYGPNATSGVVHIMTKSPLDQDKKFVTTVAMTSGFTVLDKDYKQYNNGNIISGNIINPEFRHSGKLLDGKLGYKISGSYFQAQDYPNYDPREPYDNEYNPYSTPYDGDSLIFGSARNGEVFKPDTIRRFTRDSAGITILDSAHLDVRRFKKDFFIRKYTFDGRIDIRPIKDITITINGGLAGAKNVELTGLGAAQAGGEGPGWIYWYLQTRFKWKNLYVQYFINSSDAGNTYLIPQLSASARQAYSSEDPYQVQLLIDKSKLHVVQAQYSHAPIEKLRLIYGVDVLLTRPDTKGSINGRFEKRDNLNQAGGYVQGEYEPLNWLKFVAALRVDYNSIIKNVAASPRAAVVFKPAPTHSLRITYNRAFDSPTTLNQFLDLSNGYIPNGINVRGIGNPYGWNYKYDDNTGAVQFKTAPQYRESGDWVTYGDMTNNVALFDTLLTFIVDGFKARPGVDPVQVESIFAGVFNGIRGQGGTIDSAKMISLDYANFATTKEYEASKQNVSSLFSKNLNKINNSYTQTLELGYKGLIAGKLSLQLDGYWTRVTNYVSALLPASGAVMFDWKTYLGPKAPGGKLYDNLQLAGGFYDNALKGAGLNGNPSLQNPSIVEPDSTTTWDELVVLLHQLPLGTITPNDPSLVGSDFILTYKNVGRLDVFGMDFGANYDVVQTKEHNVSLGANLSWVDKDRFTLTTGEIIYLNAPKVKTGFTFDHNHKASGFAYGLTFRYQMGYYASSSIYQGEVKPAYLLDARVSYRPNFYKGLLLSITVNNVANYQWQSFPGTPKMGATLFARAQVTF